MSLQALQAISDIHIKQLKDDIQGNTAECCTSSQAVAEARGWGAGVYVIAVYMHVYMHS